DLISEKLISIPSNFTAELWLTEMPNRDVPTKIITEYRERRDDTDMNFQEAIDSYVNDVELNEIERVAGKFDGLIKDELYCFSLTKPYSQIYDYTELISKNGTVPTLIIKFPGEIILGEVGGPCISMEAVNDIWDSSCVKKDGIICSFSPDEEAAIMGYRDIYSFFFDGYNWVKSKPLNPIYLTFEECGEVVKSKSNKNLYLKSPLSDEKIKVVAVTRDDLGVPKSSFDDGLLVIKDEWENNIEYENVDFEKIMRESNKWGIGNDALVVYYIDRKDNKRKFDKYALMEGPECSEWVKREEGIYNAYQGTYNIKEVEYDESVYY
ncbi:MAG: hypothetical protein K2N05_02015, partial [Muribaculaceae bacterium]|nr:hypothetical protein [Muribaculaceae bacterium]